MRNDVPSTLVCRGRLASPNCVHCFPIVILVTDPTADPLNQSSGQENFLKSFKVTLMQQVWCWSLAWDRDSGDNREEGTDIKDVSQWDQQN